MSNNICTLALGSALVIGHGTACAQAVPVHPGSALKDQTVVRTVRAKPDFAAITSTNVVATKTGTYATIRTGNKIIAAHRIDDPADHIGSELLAALHTRHGASSVAMPVTVRANDVAGLAMETRPLARYALDVRTTQWQVAYFPNDWSRYRLIYEAHARLIDTVSGAMVAEGHCKSMPVSSSGAPTYETMLAENAAWLRMELAFVANSCVDSLKADMLGL